jgi:hypothetical protein
MSAHAIMTADTDRTRRSFAMEEAVAILAAVIRSSAS